MKTNKPSSCPSSLLSQLVVSRGEGTVPPGLNRGTGTVASGVITCLFWGQSLWNQQLTQIQPQLHSVVYFNLDHLWEERGHHSLCTHVHVHMHMHGRTQVHPCMHSHTLKQHMHSGTRIHTDKHNCACAHTRQKGERVMLWIWMKTKVCTSFNGFNDIIHWEKYDLETLEGNQLNCPSQMTGKQTEPLLCGRGHNN